MPTLTDELASYLDDIVSDHVHDADDGAALIEAVAMVLQPLGQDDDAPLDRRIVSYWMQAEGAQAFRLLASSLSSFDTRTNAADALRWADRKRLEEAA
jgi:hypothetical protein